MVALNDLKKLTVAQDGTRFRTQDQKGVAGALHVVNGDGLGLLSD